MKLKPFNSETCIVSRNNGKPTIGINFKVGLFRFNKPCCEKIGLKPGSKISIHQDEEQPQDWYLLVNDEKGFEVRAKENVTSGVLFNNTSLTKEIAESVQFDGKSGNVLIAADPVKHEKKNYWPLITAALKKSKV